VCSGTVAAGVTNTCTFTNTAQPGTLIVKKVVVNNNGGTKLATDFKFQVNRAEALGVVQDGDTLHGKNTLSEDAATYNVTDPPDTGCAATYDNCASVVLANSGTQTCTFTNTAQPGTLIVKKIVNNTNGGTKLATDFTFQVN